MKFKIFINGTKKGTIETHDIHDFLRQNYPNVDSDVDPKKKTVHLTVSLAKAMMTNMK